MNFISRQCSLYLTSEHALELQHYQTLSGIGFNKLGFYQQCIAQPQNSFYLVTGVSQIFNQSQDTQFVSGICFNKICSAQDLTYALESINSYVDFPFRVVKVESPNLIESNFDFPSIFMVSILGLLGLVLLVCSIVHLLARLKIIDKQTKNIQCFSIIRTLEIVFSSRQRKTQRIKVFSGVKVIALLGLLFAHFNIIAYYNPTTSIYQQIEDGSFFFCFYAADLWLMVTGFFISYLLLKQYTKLRSIGTMMFKIVRRLFRIWPVYFMAVMINWYVLPLLGDGPLWSLLNNFPQRYCSNKISHYFLISNFLQDKCYSWMWLLQLQVHLCIFFIPLLILYVKSSKNVCFRYIFYIVQVILLFSSVCVAFMFDRTKEMTIFDYFLMIQYNRWNILPFFRAGGFIVGYNLGILYFKFKRRRNPQDHNVIKILSKKGMRVMLPMLGLAILGVIAWVMHKMDERSLQELDYYLLAFFRTIIPFSFVLIILPSLYGFASPIKSMFQGYICNVLSKLIQYIFMLSMLYRRESDLQLSTFSIIFLSSCAIVPSTILAILFMATIQIPIFACKKLFWRSDTNNFFQH